MTPMLYAAFVNDIILACLAGNNARRMLSTAFKHADSVTPIRNLKYYDFLTLMLVQL